jgi:hypothetical protein
LKRFRAQVKRHGKAQSATLGGGANQAQTRNENQQHFEQCRMAALWLRTQCSISDIRLERKLAARCLAVSDSVRTSGLASPYRWPLERAVAPFPTMGKIPSLPFAAARTPRALSGNDRATGHGHKHSTGVTPLLREGAYSDPTVNALSGSCATLSQQNFPESPQRPRSARVNWAHALLEANALKGVERNAG